MKALTIFVLIDRKLKNCWKHRKRGGGGGGDCVTQFEALRGGGTEEIFI